MRADKGDKGWRANKPDGSKAVEPYRLKPMQILRVVRHHWGIENDSHNTLDIQWREDHGPWCTIRRRRDPVRWRTTFRPICAAPESDLVTERRAAATA